MEITEDHMVDNILRAYVCASDDDIREGMDWYPRARALAAELDPTNVRRAVAIIAVMSPLTSWPMNVRAARTLYETGTTTNLNADKAIRIYNGEDPDNVVSGPKVSVFYSNILGGRENVTIDRHAIDVCYGRAMTNAERGKALRKGGNAILQNAYKRAAAILSDEQGKQIDGADLQAIVWIYWRRNHAVANHGDAS